MVIDCSDFILHDALLVGTLKTFNIFSIRKLSVFLYNYNTLILLLHRYMYKILFLLTI